jgi:CrcB protein
LRKLAEHDDCGTMIKPMLLVFIGGGVGSVLRFLVGRLAATAVPGGFPWGTLIVNVAGSFAAGLLIGWLAGRSGHAGTQLLLMTGLLGGFTTFSAFSIDTLTLATRQPAAAVAYVSATLLLGLLAAWGGLLLTRSA